MWPSRMISVMTLGSGSRSSRTVTLCSRDGGCTVIVSSSASSTSRGAASTWISRVASRGISPSRCASAAQAGPLHQREHHHQDEHDVEQADAVGDPATIGKVASTIGTAPRRPAHDRKTCSRQGTRNPARETTTDSGRATSSRTSPMTIAGTNSAPRSLGSTSRPSRTNRPICASQAEPFGERPGGRAVRQSGVGEHDRGQVGGEEPAGVGAACRGERDHAQPEGRERIQAGSRKSDAAQGDQPEEAAAQTRSRHRLPTRRPALRR